MKNRFHRMISIAVMITLVLTSCIIPMSAMAGGIEEDYSVDAYRYALSTRTVFASTHNGARRTLGTWVNRSGSVQTRTASYSLSNVWNLSLGANAQRKHCVGLPGNFGSEKSTHKYNVSVKPRFGVRFYATAKNFSGTWEHKKQRQVRKAYTTEWVDTNDPPEVTYSYASGSWCVFGYEFFRVN